MKKCSRTETIDGQCSETPSDVTAPQDICSTMIVLGKYMYLPLPVTSTNFSQSYFKASVYFQEQILTTVPLKLHKLLGSAWTWKVLSVPQIITINCTQSVISLFSHKVHNLTRKNAILPFAEVNLQQLRICYLRLQLCNLYIFSFLFHESELLSWFTHLLDIQNGSKDHAPNVSWRNFLS